MYVLAANKMMQFCHTSTTTRADSAALDGVYMGLNDSTVKGVEKLAALHRLEAKGQLQNKNLFCLIIFGFSLSWMNVRQRDNFLFHLKIVLY